MKEGKNLLLSGTDKNPFKEAVAQQRTLLLDGAMGSYLHKLGHKRDPILWFSHLNIENPEAVRKVHQSYIEAGADIITTNTFRTNPASVFNQSRFTQEDLVKAAAANALSATRIRDGILIAGCNPPAEESYQRERKISHSDLIRNHHNHIQLLAENGCNFILNETQGHFDEIKIICEFCSVNSIPFALSIFFTGDFKLLSGEPVDEIVQYVNDFNPLAIGFNCISITLFKSFLNRRAFDYTWGFYLNYGIGNLNDYKINDIMNPGAEQEVLMESVGKGVSFVGGCCGSEPGHIKYIRNKIYGNNNS